MITNEEALTLLELALCGDNRTIDKANVMLWREVAKQGCWSYEHGMRAVIEHRTYKPGVYLEPGHVTQRVAEVRKDISSRWAGSGAPPPRELADDPGAEILWRRRAIAEFVDRNLSLWAQGEPLVEPPSPVGDLNVKRGELPAAGEGDSPAKREALAQIARFTRRTVIAPRDFEAERAEAKVAEERKWAAVDACGGCDDEGVIGSVVCGHPPSQRVVPAAEAEAS